MANFHKPTHCSRAIQDLVGLSSANVESPRRGNRTREGDSGYNINTSYAQEPGMTQDVATIIFNSISDAVKNNPPDAATAAAVHQVAVLAGAITPDGCARLLGPNIDAAIPGVKVFIAPGGGLLMSKLDGNKFISFLNTNQDNGHRIEWCEMTGREQYEWYQAFINSGKTHLRHAANTRGLRGTNLNAITTQAGLTQAFTNSPSARSRRPANHVVPDAGWENVARALFG